MMDSGRLRTSQLWVRIALAHVKSLPQVMLFLTVMLAAAAMILPKLMAPQQNPRPRPLPSGSSGPPSVRPSPSPAVTGTPTRTSTTRSSAQVPSVTAPAGQPSTPPTPSRAPSRTAPPTTRPAPPATSPAAAPVVLTAGVRASPDSGYASCKPALEVKFTGTIRVDRTATVTSRWNPAEASTDPTTKEVSPDRDRTVTRRLTLHGSSGQTLSGTMTLIVSAPGAKTVYETAGYDITCL